MRKEGKVHLWSVVILSILIFLVYVVLVLGGAVGVFQEFPVDLTNASNTTGYADGLLAPMAAFNGTSPLFQCNISINSTADYNATNVTLYVDTAGIENIATAVPNVTVNLTDTTANQVINFTLPAALGEGTYYWACMVADNGSTAGLNSTTNRSFIIDKSPPAFTNLINTSISVTTVSTGDLVYISANFSDQFTSIDTVRLFVNISGTADNEVNTTFAANNTQVNLSFTIAASSIPTTGIVLNFTLQVNDSVNNVNITSAVIVLVTGDGSPPGHINLSNPVKSFNTSSPNVEFNFTATDANDTSLICNISVVNSPYNGEKILNITNIATTSGTPQLSSTTNVSLILSNGTYSWNVSCLDSPGNENVSLSRNFTVDNIIPILNEINITNSSQLTTGNISNFINSSGSGNSVRPGATIYLTTNLKDNLTQPLRISFQFLNVSSGNWTEADTQPVVAVTASGGTNQEYWGNASFVIPTGRTIFEGQNVSFRVVHNDTLGNSAANSTNLIVQINDTFAPLIVINSTYDGSVIINGSNITNTRPLISWSVTENNNLKSINVSVDRVVAAGIGTNIDGCGKYSFYDNTVGANNVEKFRNFSFQIEPASTDPSCPLGDGTHFINMTVQDSWGNIETSGFTFTIQSGTPTISLSTLENGLSAVNKSNVTIHTGINFTAVNGETGKLKSFSWTSSCNTSTHDVSAQISQFEVANSSFIYPFLPNVSDSSLCPRDSEANRTVTVTFEDDTGNSVTQLYQFAVDDLAPIITVHSPIEGFNTESLIQINVSAFDQMNRIDTIGYYLDGSTTLSNHTINHSILTGAQGQNTSLINASTNITAGTHTIKISVNDTLGNVRNSSAITFTYRGAYNFQTVNNTLRTALSNYSNISIFDSSGNFIGNNTAGISVDDTFKLIFALNVSANLNVTLNFNGSAANWDKLNFTVEHNRSQQDIGGIEGNFTATVLELITLNSSTGTIDKFLTDSNSYYGYIDFGINSSNVYGSSNVLGGSYELWFFSNESDLTTKTNISVCGSSAFTHKSTTACWNSSVNKTDVRVYVPHFSSVALVNDTGSPTITVNRPIGIQTESSFFANITVSNDAVLCNVSLAGGGSSTFGNKTMEGPTTFGNDKICTFHVNVTNGTIGPVGRNITFSVFDGNANVGTSTLNFNVSDLTVHNLTSVANGTTGSTTWKIDITANESVNVTINYSTTASLGGGGKIASESDFEKSQTVSLSDLSAGTIYYFNVTTCDKANNCIENGTFMFKTNAAAVTTTTTTTTTTTGGGGAAAVSKVADSKAQVWSTVPEGSSISLNVDKTTIAITSVVVNNVKSKLKNVDLEVQALKSNPVSATAAGKVNQYLRIIKKNIKDGDAETIKIGFRVTKSWLTDNGLSSADIRLYRYKSSVWNKLITRVTGTDSIYVNFEADAPGFSFFAIGSKSGGGDAFAIIDAIRGFYAGTSSLSAFEIIDMIRGFYG